MAGSTFIALFCVKSPVTELAIELAADPIVDIMFKSIPADFLDLHNIAD